MGEILSSKYLVGYPCACSKKLLDQEEVSQVAQIDAERGLTPEDVKLMKIQFSSYIKTIGGHAKVRQRVVATAIAYFRRIYTRKSFSEFDPRLVAPTCLYLASKAEESTVQAKILVFYSKKIRGTFSYLYTSPEDKAYRYDVKDILEMEMRLLEALDYYLVIYHPYRPLIQLLQDCNMPTEMTPFTWSLVNDSYRTDLILMYPPFMIALACIYIASVLNEKDTRSWFEELRVDMNVIKNIAMEILDFYDNYRDIPGERINAAVSKLPHRP
nr:cyclin-C1-1-like isoform X1 [Physcomitrium patens]|eukprot:XP_024363487.1 cyclin-C1-1-like isoform X1 [Physcomitrella patens]